VGATVRAAGSGRRRVADRWRRVTAGSRSLQGRGQPHHRLGVPPGDGAGVPGLVVQDRAPGGVVGDDLLELADEVAAVTAFLLSDDAPYLSGQSIAVDGAWTASFGDIAVDPALRARFPS